MTSVTDGVAVLRQLKNAWDLHDPVRVAALFAEDYVSRQPVHPGRNFVGRQQVQTNWTAVFEGVPDFAAEILSSSASADLVWGEWDWTGTHTDGTPFHMAGATVFVMRDGLIAEARLYLEPVEPESEGIDAAVHDLYKAPGDH